MTLPVDDPDYSSFYEYKKGELKKLSHQMEKILKLDSDLADKEVFGPKRCLILDPNSWDELEKHYSKLFSGFVADRIDGMVDSTPVETHRRDFDEFRKNILEINRKMSGSDSDIPSVVTIPEPAEHLLLKRLRKHGYDKSMLEVEHIKRGGPMYLLELFVTAARQQANREISADGGVVASSPDYSLTRKTPGSLVELTIEETKRLGHMEEEEIRRELGYPTLMIDLWKNQTRGLGEWLTEGQKGILEMATATGKTIVGIAAIAYLCGELCGEHPDEEDHEPLTEDASVLVVAHSNMILSQWEREIVEKLGLPESKIGESGQPDKVELATGTVEFRTAHSFLSHNNPPAPSDYDLAIYDEVHHYAKKDGFGQAISRPNFDMVMGLSATVGEQEGDPRREAIGRTLGDIVYVYDVEDAIEDDIIPQFEWTVHPTGFSEEEQDDWEESTERIKNLFEYIRSSKETEDFLDKLSVPFRELEDLGDFIQACQAANFESNVELPDKWEELSNSINGRTWIRHNSQPKMKKSIELARDYLKRDEGIKIVMFTMTIDAAQKLYSELNEYTDDAYVVHSEVASSNQKKDDLVKERIDRFENADGGVLIAPKLLDEGVDVPDAEVGINVAGTKGKLQLVQRMGRILRKHGDQEPHFHHFVAVPEEQYVEYVDSKEYTKELNWVYELGELISRQPDVEPADIDEDLLKKAEERGQKMWAQDLIEDRTVEAAQGTVRLDEILGSLNLNIAKTIRQRIESTDDFGKGDWDEIMTTLREDRDGPGEKGESPGDLQKVWWLFPIYRSEPEELRSKLEAIEEKLEDEDTEEDGSQKTEANSTRTNNSNEDDTAGEREKGPQGEKDVSSEVTDGEDGGDTADRVTEAIEASEAHDMPVPTDYDYLLEVKDEISLKEVREPVFGDEKLLLTLDSVEREDLPVSVGMKAAEVRQDGSEKNTSVLISANDVQEEPEDSDTSIHLRFGDDGMILEEDREKIINEGTETVEIEKVSWTDFPLEDLDIEITRIDRNERDELVFEVSKLA